MRIDFSSPKSLFVRPLFASAHLQRHVVLVILETLLLLVVARIHALLETGVVRLARRKLPKILLPVRSYGRTVPCMYGESRSVKWVWKEMHVSHSRGKSSPTFRVLVRSA